MPANRLQSSIPFRALRVGMLGFLAFGLLVAADRPPMPAFTKPVMFNTPEADEILRGAPSLPAGQSVERGHLEAAVLKNSKEMIATIGPGKSLAYNLDMAFILVPGNQKRVDAKILSYADESDKGPYPIAGRCAGRGLAAGRADARRRAGGQRRRRPTRDRRGPGEPHAL